MRELWPVDHRGAGLGRVLEAEFDRVHADLLGAHVHDALDREGRDRRARRAVGGGFRPVADDVVTNRLGVGDVIGRECAQAPVHHRRARKGAGLELEEPFGGGDLAVLFDADLDPHRRARGRPRRLEHLVAAHRHLDRAAGLFRQQRRDRLDVDDGLAAEPAADLGRGHAQIAHRHLEQLGGQRADDEMTLARRPNLALAVGVHSRGGRMRLDIALVHRGGLELLLDHEIGVLEALLDIADGEFEPLRDIGRLGRGRLDAAGDHVLEEQRRVVGHRLVDVDDVRQHLVLDPQESLGLLGDLLGGRGDRGDGVALVEHFLARHDIAGDVPEIDRDPLRPDVLELMVGEVGAGDHRLYPRQRRRLRGIDLLDARMGVRRAHHLAVERARQRQIGAVHRPAGDLGHAVRTDRPRSHPFVPRRRYIVHGWHSSSDSIFGWRQGRALRS